MSSCCWPTAAGSTCQPTCGTWTTRTCRTTSTRRFGGKRRLICTRRALSPRPFDVVLLMGLEDELQLPRIGHGERVAHLTKRPAHPGRQPPDFDGDACRRAPGKDFAESRSN